MTSHLLCVQFRRRPIGGAELRRADDEADGGDDGDGDAVPLEADEAEAPPSGVREKDGRGADARAHGRVEIESGARPAVHGQVGEQRRVVEVDDGQTRVVDAQTDDELERGVRPRQPEGEEGCGHPGAGAAQGAHAVPHHRARVRRPAAAPEVPPVAQPAEQRVVDRVPDEERRLAEPERQPVDAVDRDEDVDVVDEEEVVEERGAERDAAVADADAARQHRRRRADSDASEMAAAPQTARRLSQPRLKDSSMSQAAAPQRQLNVSDIKAFATRSQL